MNFSEQCALASGALGWRDAIGAQLVAAEDGQSVDQAGDSAREILTLPNRPSPVP